MSPPLLMAGATADRLAAPLSTEQMAQGKLAAALVDQHEGAAARRRRMLNAMPDWLLTALTSMAIKSEDKKAAPGDMTMRKFAPTLRYEALLLAEMTGTLESFRTVEADVLLLGGSKGLPFLKPSLNGPGKGPAARPPRRARRAGPRRVWRRQQDQRRRRAGGSGTRAPPLLRPAVIIHGPLAGPPLVVETRAPARVSTTYSGHDAAAGWTSRAHCGIGRLMNFDDVTRSPVRHAGGLVLTQPHELFPAGNCGYGYAVPGRGRLPRYWRQRHRPTGIAAAPGCVIPLPSPIARHWPKGFWRALSAQTGTWRGRPRGCAPYRRSSGPDSEPTPGRRTGYAGPDASLGPSRRDDDDTLRAASI